MFSIVVIKLINLANILVPKIKGQTVISAFPDFDDMTRAILEEENAIVLLANKYSKRPLWISGKVKCVYKNSIKGLWYLLTSSKIYFTHGLFRGFKIIKKERQLVINLWHGMPLKNIGFLDGQKEMPSFHYVYSSSDFFAPIMAKAFNVSMEKVLVKELPRNKILSRESTNEFIIFLKYQYNKIIVWLPTYRKANSGDIREDGSADVCPIFAFKNLDTQKLNTYLKNNNSILFIKPHPMAVHDNTSHEFSNIKVISEEWLYDYGITLYELLSASTELWTDFSSVFIDYEVTGKDMLFIMPDLQQYKNSRGTTFDLSCYQIQGEIIETERCLFEHLLTSLKLVKINE